jgi:hypothetical protein
MTGGSNEKLVFNIDEMLTILYNINIRICDRMLLEVSISTKSNFAAFRLNISSKLGSTYFSCVAVTPST